MTYKMERADYVAMVVALLKTPLGRRLRNVALFYICCLLPILVIGGSLENIGGFFKLLWQRELPWWFYLLLVAVPVFSLTGYQPLAVLSAWSCYKQIAIADLTVNMTFDDAGIRATGANISSNVGWNAVKRVIDDSKHLFIAVSKREALIVPKRVFNSPSECDAFRAFLLRKVAGAAAHER